MQQNANPSLKSPAISNKQKTIVEFSEKESRVLYRLGSLFPLDPFPTTVTIQPSTISIVHNLFGLSQNLMTVTMEDIFTVEVEAGLFFANLKIQQKQPLLPIVEITYLWKDQAMKARRIIQGLLVVQTKNLEIPDMTTAELIPYLEEIGSTQVPH